MKLPDIITLPQRRGARFAPVLALLSLTACGKSPTTPDQGPQPLSIACPAAVSNSSLNGQPLVMSFSNPTTTGGSAPVSITCTPASGALFAAGATTVTCTATDSGGRSAMCGFEVSVSAVPTIARTRFMAFGDSLTEGKVSLAPLLLLDAGPHSYPARLGALLSARYISQTIIVTNEGWGGERADESFSRFRDALSQHRPEAVLLMHGVNDLNSSTPGRVESTADAVEDLIKETRNVGAAAFVATLPPFGSGPKASCPECIEPFNSRIRAVAAAKGATLVDVHAAWRTELMGADGIHPTAAGYEVIAAAFFEAIRRTLENPMGDSR